MEGLLRDARVGLQEIIDNPFGSDHRKNLTATLQELDIEASINEERFKQHTVNSVITNLDNTDFHKYEH